MVACHSDLYGWSLNHHKVWSLAIATHLPLLVGAADVYIGTQASAVIRSLWQATILVTTNELIVAALALQRRRILRKYLTGKPSCKTMPLKQIR